MIFYENNICFLFNKKNMETKEELKLPSICLKTLEGHKEPILVAKFNRIFSFFNDLLANGNYCMTGSQDKSIILWNPQKGILIKTYTGPHNHEVSDIAISPDNNTFASVGGDKLVFYWDVTTGNVIRKFQGHTQSINCVAFNPQKNCLVSGSVDTTVRIWDLDAKPKPGFHIMTKEIQILDKQKDSVTQIFVLDDQIIVGSLDGFIRIYDIRMGTLSSDDVGSPIMAMDLSEDQNYFLVSCIDSKIRLFDRKEGEIIATYEGGHIVQKFKASVKFGLDNKHFYASSETHSACIYDIGTKKEKYKLVGHSKPVVSLDRHPTQSNIILTGSFDKTAKLWG